MGEITILLGVGAVEALTGIGWRQRCTLSEDALTREAKSSRLNAELLSHQSGFPLA